MNTNYTTEFPVLHVGLQALAEMTPEHCREVKTPSAGETSSCTSEMPRAPSPLALEVTCQFLWKPKYALHYVSNVIFSNEPKEMTT